MENGNEYNWDEGLLIIKKKIEEMPADKKPLIIGVAGGSCSGKTLLASELARHLGPEQVVVVNLDDYYKDARDPSLPRDENGRAIFDSPEAYRAEEFILAVKRLSEGEEIWTPEYDMATNAFIGSWGKKLNPRRIIIAEGLFAVKFLAASRKLLKVYLKVNYQNALKRRVSRDTRKYKVEAARVERDFKENVWPRQLKFIASQANQADIIINQKLAKARKEEKNHE